MQRQDRRQTRYSRPIPAPPSPNPPLVVLAEERRPAAPTNPGPSVTATPSRPSLPSEVRAHAPVTSIESEHPVRSYRHERSGRREPMHISTNPGTEIFTQGIDDSGRPKYVEVRTRKNGTPSKFQGFWYRERPPPILGERDDLPPPPPARPPKPVNKDKCPADHKAKMKKLVEQEVRAQIEKMETTRKKQEQKAARSSKPSSALTNTASGAAAADTGSSSGDLLLTMDVKLGGARAAAGQNSLSKSWRVTAV